MENSYAERRRGLPARMTMARFVATFQQAFSREMTPDERRYFQLSSILLGEDTNETSFEVAGLFDSPTAR